MLVEMAFAPRFLCRPATERLALSILAHCTVFLVYRDFDLTGKWLMWLLLKSFVGCVKNNKQNKFELRKIFD